MSSLGRYLGIDEETLDATLAQGKKLLNKDLRIRQQILYMLNRTSQMFEYSGLPDTMPPVMIERMLQTHGYVVVAKPPTASIHSNKLYGVNFDYEATADDKPFAFWSGLGGKQDVYYTPTKAIICSPSPFIHFDKEYTINKDCIVVKNDANALGLLPLHYNYAAQIVEAEISLRSALINSRQSTIIIADNDIAMESAQIYLDKIERGEFGIIEDAALIGNTRTTKEGTSAPNSIIQVIEGIQYLKASWFNEVGLNSSFNMKREYLSSEEIAANADVLMPLVDDMLTARQKGWDNVNKMFGLNVTVRKNSAWENKELEKEKALEMDSEQELGQPNSEGSEQK